jgi:hypothetical protein
MHELLKLIQAIAMREMELWRDKIQLRIRDRIQNSVSIVTELFSRSERVDLYSGFTNSPFTDGTVYT